MDPWKLAITCQPRSETRESRVISVPKVPERDEYEDRTASPNPDEPELLHVLGAPHRVPAAAAHRAVGPRAQVDRAAVVVVRMRVASAEQGSCNGLIAPGDRSAGWSYFAGYACGVLD